MSSFEENVKKNNIWHLMSINSQIKTFFKILVNIVAEFPTAIQEQKIRHFEFQGRVKDDDVIRFIWLSAWQSLNWLFFIVPP